MNLTVSSCGNVSLKGCTAGSATMTGCDMVKIDGASSLGTTVLSNISLAITKGQTITVTNSNLTDTGSTITSAQSSHITAIGSTITLAQNSFLNLKNSTLTQGTGGCLVLAQNSQVTNMDGHTEGNGFNPSLSATSVLSDGTNLTLQSTMGNLIINAPAGTIIATELGT